MTDVNVEMQDLPYRRFDGVPGRAVTAAVALIVVGALALIAGLFIDAERTWQAYLFNWLFWVGIAQGAVIFAAVLVITRAIWARSIRRLALSFAAFLPIAFVLYLPLTFAGEHIFPWTSAPYHEGMEVWLNEPFVAVRNIILLGALFSLSIWFAVTALRPDSGLLGAGSPPSSGIYGRISGNWRGQETEEVHAHKRLSVLAPILVLVYVAAMSMVAWDYIMSLEAGWFSTLIGPYYFMGAFLGGIAATSILAVICRAALDLRGIIEPPHFHDLGKLTFAFCIFWAYLFWSQFIVIWYGMLPHEQAFLVHRLSEPYAWLSVLVLFLLFIAPFAALIGVRAKKSPPFLATIAGVILLGLWIERYVLVYPSLHPDAPSIPFGWQEPGIALLFAGLFVGAVGWFLSTFPVLQIWQPMVDPHEFDEDRINADLGYPLQK